MELIEHIMFDIKERINLIENDKLIDSEKKKIIIKENNMIYVRCQQLLLGKITKNNKEMQQNELKKELYKQNPLAKFQFIRKGHAYYEAVLNLEPHNDPDTFFVSFMIPVDDMGETDFTPTMPAKLLIRWIY